MPVLSDDKVSMRPDRGRRHQMEHWRCKQRFSERGFRAGGVTYVTGLARERVSVSLAHEIARSVHSSQQPRKNHISPKIAAITRFDDVPPGDPRRWISTVGRSSAFGVQPANTHMRADEARSFGSIAIMTGSTVCIGSAIARSRGGEVL